MTPSPPKRTITLMRRLLVVAILALAAGSCGRGASPTQPLAGSTTAVPVFADFSGITHVTYKETACRGWRDCWYSLGHTRSVELRLEQNGPAVSGLLLESSASAFRVTGTVSQDGELTLAGWRPRVETYEDGYDSGRGLETFKLRRDAAGTATGSITLIGDSNGYFRGQPGYVSETGEITAANRMQSLPVLPGFEGRWRGRYLVRSCDGKTNAYCPSKHTGQMDWFTMTLDSSGSLLSGTISGIASVSGTAAGDTLVLAADGPVPGDSRMRSTITSWSTYRDATGELHGSFTYVLETPYYRTTYDIELYYVLLDSPATVIR